MKYLITGMNGMIGTVLKAQPLADGHTVIGYDRKADFIYDQRMRDSYANMPPLDKRLHFLT